MAAKRWSVSATKKEVLKHLLHLSRFHKYTPLFACFAGVWSTLLAGAAKLADQPSEISPAFVFRQTALIFLASYIFYGAGTGWNDWVDRDIDANVARTKDRPLASGKITTAQAMVWIGLQSVVTWYILHVMLGGKDVWEHYLPAIVASICYPYGKRPAARRFYVYPQYFLGFTVAWPAVPGWAAIYGQDQSFTKTARQCFPLCIMVCFWTLYLNTAYSYQDVVDDRKMNVNSLYNLFGQRIHHLLVALVSPVVVCMLLFIREFDSPWLWTTWVGSWIVSFIEQLVRFDPKQPASGGTLHKSNFMLGIWTIVACAVEVFRAVKVV
ncbi:UbiA prenyltransferase family protein [Macrophomina phaseolina]|uniref:UbiA prenyltransferase family protein n=1 Tax=Macrophomina phaseolina TaxID=35725 RepID=A0ABQ8FUH6_9PEZI|nr:UbiA prenyltransferase family protein [Macrophomina phaseolina]